MKKQAFLGMSLVAATLVFMGVQMIMAPQR